MDRLTSCLLMCGPLAGPPVEMPVRSAEDGAHRGQDYEARQEAGEQGNSRHTDAARAAQHPQRPGRKHRYDHRRWIENNDGDLRDGGEPRAEPAKVDSDGCLLYTSP